MPPMYTINTPVKHAGVIKRSGEIELSAKVGARLVKIGAVVPVSQEVSASVDTDTMLLGSSTLPSTFLLADGGELALSDAVRRAFDGSGMTIEDWNDLAEDVRDRHLLARALLLGAVRPGEQNLIQPSADRADGLSVDGAEAGAPASAPETISTTEAYVTSDEPAQSPSGEAQSTDAAAPSNDSPGGEVGKPEAPAAEPAPKASAEASTKSAKKKR